MYFLSYLAFYSRAIVPRMRRKTSGSRLPSLPIRRSPPLLYCLRQENALFNFLRVHYPLIKRPLPGKNFFWADFFLRTATHRRYLRSLSIPIVSHSIPFSSLLLGVNTDRNILIPAPKKYSLTTCQTQRLEPLHQVEKSLRPIIHIQQSNHHPTTTLQDLCWHHNHRLHKCSELHRQ